MHLDLTIQGQDELRRLFTEARRIIADEGVRLGVIEGVRAGAEEAKTKHTFTTKTGTLERGIYGRPTSRTADACNGEIVSLAPYSSFVENGTRPHDIRPKEGHGFVGPLKGGQSRRAKTDIGTHRVALRFEQGGQTIFRRVVHHPGSPPHPFMGQAYFKAERVMQATIERAFRKAAALFEVQK